MAPLDIYQNQTLDNYTKDSFCKIFTILTVNAQTVGKEIHRHNFFQVVLLRQGTVHHWIDFEGQEATAPYLSVIFPNQMHKLELSEDAEADIIMFDETVFCSAILSNELKEYNIDLQSRLNHITNIPSQDWENILSIYKSIQSIWDEMNMIKKMQIKFLIKIILLKAIDIAPTNHTIGNIDTDLQFYQKFRDMVNTSYISQRKVIYYAEQLGVSTKKLTSICYKYTGKSPLDIIHEKLSVELKKAVVQEGLLLKEIAFRFGFSSQSALNKFIEKRFGCTPQVWRNELERNMMGKL